MSEEKANANAREQGAPRLLPSIDTPQDLHRAR